MLENRRPSHSAFRLTNCRSKQALQVKWVMPWELFVIHRQNTKNAFRFKLRLFVHKELREESAPIVVKKTAIC